MLYSRHWICDYGNLIILLGCPTQWAVLQSTCFADFRVSPVSGQRQEVRCSRPTATGEAKSCYGASSFSCTLIDRSDLKYRINGIYFCVSG